VFDEIFFDSPSTYAVNFTATFPSGIVVWSVYYGLSVTRGVVTAGLQDGFVVANQTAGLPFPLQPAVTVRDDLGGVVTSDVGALLVTANITRGPNASLGDPPARLRGATQLLTERGVAAFTDLSIDRAGEASPPPAPRKRGARACAARRA